MPLSDLELCCRCRNRVLVVYVTPASAHPGEIVQLAAAGAVGEVTWGALTLGPQGALASQGGNSGAYVVSEVCPCQPYSVIISAADECSLWEAMQSGNPIVGTASTSFMVDHWPFSVTVTPFCDGASEAFSLTVEGGCPPWLVQKYTTGTGWVDYTTIQEDAGPFTLGSYVAPSCSITYRVRGANCPNDSDRHWQQFTLTPGTRCVTCETPDRPETVTIGGGPDGWRVILGQNYNITLAGAETYTGRVVWSVNNAGCTLSGGSATGVTLNVGTNACDYNAGQITITVEVGPECCDISDTQSAQAGTWVQVDSCTHASYSNCGSLVMTGCPTLPFWVGDIYYSFSNGLHATQTSGTVLKEQDWADPAPCAGTDQCTDACATTEILPPPCTLSVSCSYACCLSRSYREYHWQCP